MSPRSKVALQCKKAQKAFWKHVGFTPTPAGEAGMYEASTGYTEMSVSLRDLKKALREKSAPEEELEKVTLNTKASPKPNPNPNPNPNPKPDPNPNP